MIKGYAWQGIMVGNKLTNVYSFVKCIAWQNILDDILNNT